jgi:mannose-6-phosphate isomerase
MRYQRPWGYYETILEETGYLVKRIVIHAGQRLSLQRHQHRQEHWVIVSGSGQVTLEHDTHPILAGEHISVPLGCKHRIASDPKQEIVMIEVQLGDELREDDIERFADDYGRDTK